MPLFLVTEQFWMDGRLVAHEEFAVDAADYEGAAAQLRELIPQIGGVLTTDNDNAVRFTVGAYGVGMMGRESLRLAAEFLADYEAFHTGGGQKGER